MSITTTPWIDAHRHLVTTIGYTPVSFGKLKWTIAECKKFPPGTSDEEFIDGMIERNLISFKDEVYIIRKRMVVNCKVDPYDIFIGRGSPWGNPFLIGIDGNRHEVIEKYRAKVLGDSNMVDKIRRELKGRVLGCYCSPLPCHGEVLVEIAEQSIF